MNRGFYNFLLRLYRFGEAKIFWRLPLRYQRRISETALSIKKQRFSNVSEKVSGLRLPFMRARPLPVWVIGEMEEIGRTIDPQLCPTKNLLSKIIPWSVPVSPKLGLVYAKLVASLDTDYTHCFILSWLQKGGADLGALHHINAVSEMKGTKILVILTEHAESPWLSRLPSSVKVLSFGAAASGLSFSESMTILVRILVQLAPPVIHNIQSRLAWEAIRCHGLALRQKSQIFASLFCDALTIDGYPIGFACEYLPFCYQHLTKVLCDNASFPQSLIKEYGYSISLFEVVYFPTILLNIAPQRPVSSTRQILWAGRFDRQKRVDLLAKIAAALPDCHFLVFGGRLLDTDGAALHALQQLPNVEIRGAYDGFVSLPTAECDLFLYTSEWDGIPNVLLEAISHGLPVVASNVGGIAELINEESGYLIEPFDSVSAFVSAIKNILENQKEAQFRAAHALEIIKHRHAVGTFKHSLVNLVGYQIL